MAKNSARIRKRIKLFTRLGKKHKKHKGYYHKVFHSTLARKRIILIQNRRVVLQACA